MVNLHGVEPNDTKHIKTKPDYNVKLFYGPAQKNTVQITNLPDRTETCLNQDKFPITSD